MGLAVDIKGGCGRIVAEPNRPVLVRHARQRNALAQEQTAGQESLVALVTVHAAPRLLLHQAFELLDEAPMAFLVIGPIGEHDVAVPVQAHSVLRVGQIFRGEPEVEGMPAHEVERPAGSDGRGTSLEGLSVELAHEGDVAQRVLPVVGAEVEVVEGQRLLEDGGIRTLRERHEHGVDVARVVPSHHVRAIGKTPRVSVTGRSQEEGGGVDGSARDHDHPGRVRLLRPIPLDMHRRHLAP